MTRAVVYAGLAAWVVSLGGCGTMMNFWWDGSFHEPAVYGGTATSAGFGLQAAEEVAKFDNLDHCADCVVIAGYFLAVDLPLSVVADTLTLPLTVAAALQKLDPGKPAPAIPPAHGPEPVQPPTHTPASPRRDSTPGA